MKLNLLKCSALLCGLFLLGSCAQEAPQADNKTQVEEGPRVSVPLNLEVSVDAFDTPKSLDQEARAYTGAKTPITVKDGSNKELNDDLSASSVAQKVLTRSKAAFIAKNPKLDAVAQIYIKKGGTVKTYIQQIKLTYDATKQKYTYGGNVNIEDAILEKAKTADQFTLTLYAGGVSYNASTKSFELPSIMEEVSLSALQSTPVELPLLYKSAPVAFRVNEVGGVVKGLEPVSQAAASLKPLGSLLLLTFRNNMQQGITFDGVTAVSNSFFGPNNDGDVTTYKIEDGTFSTDAGNYTNPNARSSNGGAAFTYFYKDFASARFFVPAGGARSDKAILFWGFYEGTSKAASASNKLTASNGTNLLADVLTPATSVLHVYAQNVKAAAGRTPSRPNYNIAPIGGANLKPESGKAYTLNCEFYDQAPQMLGYFAKGYLYKDSQWKLYDFDGYGSSDPSIYQGIGDDNKLLVNSKDANEVRNGVTVSSSSPDGRGTMYMPDEDWFYLFGLTAPLEFQTGGARYKDLAGFATGYRGYVIKTDLPYKDVDSESVPFQKKKFVYADYRVASQTLTAGGGIATVYRQLYMEPRNSAGLQPRSKYQTIMRVMAKAVSDYTTGDGQGGWNTYPSALTMESLYVGKYFVGNVMTTPLYVKRGASQPFLYAEDGDAFWHKAEVALDRVDRATLNVRTYGYGQIAQADLQKTYRDLRTKTRAEAHLSIHWCDGAMEAEFMDNSSSTTALGNYINNTLAVRDENDKIRNRTYGFANVKGGIWTINKRVASDNIAPRLRSNSFQALRPYSTRYQGNKGFETGND